MSSKETWKGFRKFTKISKSQSCRSERKKQDHILFLPAFEERCILDSLHCPLLPLNRTAKNNISGALLTLYEQD